MLNQTLGAKAAAALDQELMSTCAFSIDQLMELAGLAVSQAGRLRRKWRLHLASVTVQSLTDRRARQSIASIR